MQTYSVRKGGLLVGPHVQSRVRATKITCGGAQSRPRDPEHFPRAPRTLTAVHCGGRSTRHTASACRSPTGELCVPRSPTGELSVPISDGRGTPLRAARWRPGQVHPRAQPVVRSECAAAAAPAQSGVLVAARALWNWKPTPAGASPRRWSLQRRGACQWRSRSFEVRLCARWPLQPPCRPQPCSSSPCVSHELPSPPPPQR